MAKIKLEGLLNEQVLLLNNKYEAIMHLLVPQMSIKRSLEFARQGNDLRAVAENIEKVMKIKNKALNDLITERDEFQSKVKEVIKEKEGIKDEEINVNDLQERVSLTFPKVKLLNEEWAKYQEAQVEQLKSDSGFVPNYLVEESDFPTEDNKDAKKKIVEVLSAILYLMK